LDRISPDGRESNMLLMTSRHTATRRIEHLYGPICSFLLGIRMQQFGQSTTATGQCHRGMSAISKASSEKARQPISTTRILPTRAPIVDPPKTMLTHAEAATFPSCQAADQNAQLCVGEVRHLSCVFACIAMLSCVARFKMPMDGRDATYALPWPKTAEKQYTTTTQQRPHRRAELRVKKLEEKKNPHIVSRPNHMQFAKVFLLQAKSLLFPSPTAGSGSMEPRGYSGPPSPKPNIFFLSSLSLPNLGA
jgi:hypothetical protein